MTGIALVGGIIFGLMLAEARLSRANERALRELGGIAPPGDVYAVLAVLYPGVFLAMVGEGMWRVWAAPAPAEAGSNWWLSGALLFSASKALKYWAIRALGVRWSFRIIVVPDLPLVTTGPYRYVAHPNYLAVCGELAGAAMMCGAPVTGIVGSLVYGCVLWRRARFEASVLRRVRAGDYRSGKVSAG